MQNSESDSDCSEPKGDASEDEDGTEETEQGLVLEDWVSWICRATDFAEEQLAKARITDWVTEQRKRYWQFAGNMARISDDRWSSLVLSWSPQGYL